MAVSGVRKNGVGRIQGIAASGNIGIIAALFAKPGPRVNGHERNDV
jgi:hypothetical protein